MVKIEADTLANAYALAAAELTCSVTELKIEVIQNPSNGFFGLFSKKAIIVAACKMSLKDELDREIESKSEKHLNIEKTEEKVEVENIVKTEVKAEVENIEKTEAKIEVKNVKATTPKVKDTEVKKDFEPKPSKPKKSKQKSVKKHDKKRDNFKAKQTPVKEEKAFEHVQSESFVTDQDDDEDDYIDHSSFLASAQDDDELESQNADMLDDIRYGINNLFKEVCFDLNTIKVEQYDDETVLVEFTGDDCALLIGKEGYRYKALSYMIFNWINSKYNMQLRLEIAEFLKNQEESILRYLESVKENVERDGRAQTRILDGVLVQIALKELRSCYPQKYVAPRTTKDGLKFIIINDYNEY